MNCSISKLPIGKLGGLESLIVVVGLLNQFDLSNLDLVVALVLVLLKHYYNLEKQNKRMSCTSRENNTMTSFVNLSWLNLFIS